MSATTMLALPVVMSQACSALIAEGAVFAAVLLAPGGFRYHWPTAGPPLVAPTGREA